MTSYAQRISLQQEFESKRLAAVYEFQALLKKRPLLMGILNVTPDSFSDGGMFNAPEQGISRAKTLFEDGADIVDIGAESTRPDAVVVALEDELTRLKRHLPDICHRTNGLVSIDTYKSKVAEYACLQGVGIVNDVWGFEREPEMANVIADMQAIAIVMHNRDGIDASLDILEDIARFVDRAVEKAHKAGIPESNIVIDPGIGFGKTPEQNFEIIRKIQLLKTFGFPVLIGLSNKRMIGALTGKSVEERLHGTLAANTIALMNGVDIIRVHDVASHLDVMKVVNELG